MKNIKKYRAVFGSLILLLLLILGLSNCKSVDVTVLGYINEEITLSDDSIKVRTKTILHSKPDSLLLFGSVFSKSDNEPVEGAVVVGLLTNNNVIIDTTGFTGRYELKLYREKNETKSFEKIYVIKSGFPTLQIDSLEKKSTLVELNIGLDDGKISSGETHSEFENTMHILQMDMEAIKKDKKMYNDFESKYDSLYNDLMSMINNL